MIVCVFRFSRSKDKKEYVIASDFSWLKKKEIETSQPVKS